MQILRNCFRGALDCQNELFMIIYNYDINSLIGSGGYMSLISKMKALLVVLCFFSNMYAQPKNDGFVDIVVILNASCREILHIGQLKQEPCCNELYNAVKDDQIVVLSPSLLYGMLKRKNDARDYVSACIDRIIQHYAIYLNADEDFLVLVPSNPAKDLAEYGFSGVALSRIEPDMLLQFGESRWESTIIKIEHFIKLFKVPEAGRSVLPKCIYLISHGIDALDEIKHFSWSIPLISNLTVWQFVNFLHMLQDINTQFLHVASCYATGINLRNMRGILAGEIRDERCMCMSEPISFPIVLQGTTDSPVSAIVGDWLGCKNYFSYMHQWLNDGAVLSGLADILSRSLYKNNCPALTANLPLVVRGGCAAERVPLQNVMVINGIRGVQTVSSGIQSIFINSINARDLTLSLETIENIPIIRAVEETRSVHFIGSLELPNIEERELIPLLESCFLSEVLRNSEGTSAFGISDRAWFIDSIRSRIGGDIVARGVAVQKGCLKYAEHQGLIVYQDAHGMFHRIKATLPCSKTMRNEIISEQEYKAIAERIFWECSAKNFAYDDAEKALREFFQQISLGVPQVNIALLLHEDIQNINSGRIAKHEYLHYLAHIHDTEMILGVLNLCKTKSDCISYNDFELLLECLIDVEQHEISIDVVYKMLKYDDVVVQQTALNVLLYMVESGLYIHAYSVSDDLLSIVKELSSREVLSGGQVALIHSIATFYAHVMCTMIQAEQREMVDKCLCNLLDSNSWYTYGLGLEACNLILESGKDKVLLSFNNNRLNWFTDQLKQRLTQSALAVYYDQLHVVDRYANLVYC